MGITLAFVSNPHDLFLKIKANHHRFICNFRVETKVKNKCLLLHFIMDAGTHEYLFHSAAFIVITPPAHSHSQFTNFSNSAGKIVAQSTRVSPLRFNFSFSVFPWKNSSSVSNGKRPSFSSNISAGFPSLQIDTCFSASMDKHRMTDRKRPLAGESPRPSASGHLGPQQANILTDTPMGAVRHSFIYSFLSLFAKRVFLRQYFCRRSLSSTPNSRSRQ